MSRRWRVLQRILPRGLYWRAALILLVPIVTIQLVVSTAFIQRHYEGVTRQMTNGVAIDLQFLLAEIEASGSPEAALARVGPLAQGAGGDADDSGGANRAGRGSVPVP